MGFSSPIKEYRRRKLTRRGFAGAKKKKRSALPERSSRHPGGILITLLLAVTVWFVATISVVHQRSIPSYDYVPGQKATRDVYSEIPFEYVDLAQTEVLHVQAARQVPPVYRIEKEHLNDISRSLAALKTIVAQLPENEAETVEEIAAASPVDNNLQQVLQTLRAEGKLAPLQELFQRQELVAFIERSAKVTAAQGIVSSQPAEIFFVDMTDSDQVSLLDPHERRTTRTVGSFLDPEKAVARIMAQFSQQYPHLSIRQEAALTTILGAILRPNLVYARDATIVAQNQAAADVQTVHKFVDADTRLLRRGEVVTDEHLVQLRTHAEELQRQRKLENSVRDIVLYATINLLLILVGGYGLYLIYPQAVTRKATLTLIAVVALLQLLLVRVGIDLYYIKYSPAVFLLALLPLALGAMLISQVVSVRAALWVGLFTSLLAGLQHGSSYQLFLVGSISSFTAAVLARGACRRHQVFRAGLGVAASVFVVNVVFVISHNQPLNTILPLAAFALLNGLGTATLTSTIMPFFEFTFGVTSNTSLLELSDLNHPLLKRLQIEAPGTYHHSLMVAMIAEQAAHAIGANPLLARVCAYFHDIGKMSQPDYFVENATFGHDSPHERLQPRMSSLVILNHVKEGLQLAAKHKLKKIIREGITQHHGTSLVYYFYRRALDKTEEKDSGNIGQEDYRYPGPLPMRKEIVLISIADACEAACRSLLKPTPRKIQSLVDDIVMGRIADGQLDRADLTFEELAIAKQTIVKALTTMLHGRIAYPKTKRNDKPETDKASIEAAIPESQAV